MKRISSLLGADYGSDSDASGSDSECSSATVGDASAQTVAKPAGEGARKKRMRFAGPELLVTTITFDTEEPVDPTAPEPVGDCSSSGASNEDDVEEEDEEEGFALSAIMAVAAEMEGARPSGVSGGLGTSPINSTTGRSTSKGGLLRTRTAASAEASDAWTLAEAAADERRRAAPPTATFERPPGPTPPARTFCFAAVTTTTTVVSRAKLSGVASTNASGAPGANGSGGGGGQWAQLIPETQVMLGNLAEGVITGFVNLQERENRGREAPRQAILIIYLLALFISKVRLAPHPLSRAVVICLWCFLELGAA